MKLGNAAASLSACCSRGKRWCWTPGVAEGKSVGACPTGEGADWTLVPVADLGIDPRNVDGPSLDGNGDGMTVFAHRHNNPGLGELTLFRDNTVQRDAATDRERATGARRRRPSRHIRPEQCSPPRKAKPRSAGLSSEGAYGIRTRAAAVRGRCPRPLDECAGRRASVAGRSRSLLGRSSSARAAPVSSGVEAEPARDLLARRPRPLAKSARSTLAGLAAAPPVLADLARSGTRAAAPSGSTRAGSRPSRSRRPCRTRKASAR